MRIPHTDPHSPQSGSSCDMTKSVMTTNNTIIIINHTWFASSVSIQFTWKLCICEFWFSRPNIIINTYVILALNYVVVQCVFNKRMGPFGKCLARKVSIRAIALVVLAKGTRRHTPTQPHRLNTPLMSICTGPGFTPLVRDWCRVDFKWCATRRKRRGGARRASYMATMQNVILIISPVSQWGSKHLH